MNFHDQLVTCAVCGKTFVFTVTEQRKLFESGQGVLDPDKTGVAAPTQCSGCGLKDPETGRCSGQIKWFNHEKGYGFIVKSDAEEIFFHRSQLVDGTVQSLDEGVPVTFEEGPTDRGVEARQVRIESQ